MVTPRITTRSSAAASAILEIPDRRNRGARSRESNIRGSFALATVTVLRARSPSSYYREALSVTRVLVPETHLANFISHLPVISRFQTYGADYPLNFLYRPTIPRVTSARYALVLTLLESFHFGVSR